MQIFKFIILLFFVSVPVAFAFNFPSVNPLSDPLSGGRALIIGTCGSETSETCVGINNNNPSAKLTIKKDFRVDSSFIPDLSTSIQQISGFFIKLPAFDNNKCNIAYSDGNIGHIQYIGQNFGSPKAIRRVSLFRAGTGYNTIECPGASTGSKAFNAKLQYSDTGNNPWTDTQFLDNSLASFNLPASDSVLRIYDLKDNGAHQYWRFLNNAPGVQMQINEIEMMDQVLVSFESLTIKNVSGNVGINNFDPQYQLDVTGNANVSANVIIGAGKEVCISGDCKSDWPTVGIPSGAVMAFDLSACPSGWSEFTVARGRYIVGLPSGGTLDSTVGAALTNSENRYPMLQHTDQLPPNGDWTLAGGQVYGYRAIYSTIPTQINGTSAPYIQTIICKKS